MVSQVSSKVLSASWTRDGNFLVLGHLNGAITIRDSSGAEKVGITGSYDRRSRNHSAFFVRVKALTNCDLALP